MNLRRLTSGTPEIAACGALFQWLPLAVKDCHSVRPLAKPSQLPRRRGVTPFSELYGEAPLERSGFFRLEVYRKIPVIAPDPRL